MKVQKILVILAVPISLHGYDGGMMKPPLCLTKEVIERTKISSSKWVS